MLFFLLRNRVRSILFCLAHAYRGKGFIHPSSEILRGVSVGQYTNINHPSFLGAGCRIGKLCAIGGRLVVRTENHDYSYLNMNYRAQKSWLNSTTLPKRTSEDGVTIGNAVWIGDSVIVLPGVSIGNGAVIGAGSVVTKSVPDYAVVAGTPARFLRWRFSEKIIALLAGRAWWDLEGSDLEKVRRIFESPLTPESARELCLAVDNQKRNQSKERPLQ
ncbi:CatB-related O-acetyltransferase [Shimia sediminis]|uniref:CatB-related O-acetyltransferase n=1 Tax=Shimia sediminis TaxID=2497945 RepID=UPI000F8ED690|nr:CatB-related O-acetyltransferase [Shimia sediminis]